MKYFRAQDAINGFLTRACDAGFVNRMEPASMKHYKVSLDAVIPSSIQFVIRAESSLEAERDAIARWREYIHKYASGCHPDYLVINLSDPTTELDYAEIASLCPQP